MARPRRISDDQILSSMRRGVLAHGSHVPLETVARDLSVTVPALLKRFGTRQALMLAALRPTGTPPWIEVARRGPDERPLETQLHEMFTQMLDYLGEVVPCLAALRESGIPREQVFDKNGPEKAHLALRRWLERGREKGLVTATELDAIAYSVLGAIHSRAFFSHLRTQKFSARAQREFISELATFFARALRTASA